MAMVSFLDEPIVHDDAEVPPPLFKMTPAALRKLLVAAAGRAGVSTGPGPVGHVDITD